METILMLPTDSMYTIQLPEEYKQYYPLFYDLMRMFMVQIVVNLLFYLSNPKSYKFLNAMFMKTLLFIIVGISSYWLVIRKLVGFK
tara:strand:+ start:152 stop:409 length:258 start_codon:yes stop_codon:yes gene_type:complete